MEQFRQNIIVCPAAEMIDRLKVYEELGVDENDLLEALGVEPIYTLGDVVDAGVRVSSGARA